MKAEINWGKIEDRYNERYKILIEELKKLCELGPLEVSAKGFIQEIDGFTEAEAQDFLSDIAGMGYLEKRNKYVCPFKGCVLKEDQKNERQCPECNNFFCDSEEGIKKVVYFYRDNPIGRDVRWFVALHGMNTKGKWQEEFSWRVSTTYRRSVPVAIYKYGIVRPGAVLKWRQRQLIDKVIERLRYFSKYTIRGGFGGKPDIIAHSFGTWLIGHALQKDKSLKVGRIILTGCILRPDFNWQRLKEENQIEEVLNHYGAKDFWAKIAHYIIPNSGPSGRYGFNKSLVISKKEKNFRHCDFFKQENMSKNFPDVWWPFLQKNESQLKSHFTDEEKSFPWKESNWFIRATIPRFLILGLSLGIFFLILSLTCFIFSSIKDLIF